tara:strand:+ start:118 stop:381 length:264 start_codon:yes stop_codon:yes gene_type:complete
MKTKSSHKRILKEGAAVLKAMLHARDDDGNKLDVCNLEIYLTDSETGQVLELEIGVDEEGDLEKTFGKFDDSVEIELEEEEYTGLLN